MSAAIRLTPDQYGELITGLLNVAMAAAARRAGKPADELGDAELLREVRAFIANYETTDEVIARLRRRATE